MNCREWAKQIKAFDNGKCVLCGAGNPSIYEQRPEAHHIKRRSTHPELALDLLNGITLCNQCHRVVTSCETNGSVYRPLERYLNETTFILIPKGRKATVEACAAEHGQSINGLVNALLMDAAGLTEAEWKQPPADPLEE